MKVIFVKNDSSSIDYASQREFLERILSEHEVETVEPTDLDGRMMALPPVDIVVFFTQYLLDEAIVLKRKYGTVRVVLFTAWPSGFTNAVKEGVVVCRKNGISQDELRSTITGDGSFKEEDE